MQNLKSVLDAAAGEGIISTEQASTLVPYLEERGVTFSARTDTGATDIAGPRGGDAIAPVEDTEAPRFIRGFHDVLITIGIVIVLSGIWGIGSFFAALPAIIILAEVLVRRQRLALPAVVLTIAYIQWIFVVTLIGLDEAFGESVDPVLQFLVMAVPFPVALLPFYWRYRIPLSLGLLILSVFTLALALVFMGLSRATGDPDFVSNRPAISSTILLVTALGLFAVAMWYDLSDRLRISRRSDIAFWLHLVAAPALLYSMLAFVFLGKFDSSIFSGDAGATKALVVVGIVILFMAVGLIIDRRAFVTSGLVSLGLATASILQKMQAQPESYAFATLLIVGLIVLTIGVGWPHFRRWIFAALPPALKEKLPPLR
ncbi:hypothetical protein LJR030_005537 [Rhizobium sp. LjRoot30]|uniref:hypothetical protein n=1 Tax=Rhizobium sp. LjRoot30 TaxID=3342320 RepID=UPI003ECC240E